jgi:hypothetical protein
MAAAVAELEALNEAIDGLAGLDVEGLSDEQLHDVMVGVQRLRARLGLVAGGLVGRWDARHVWAGDGSRSAAARLSREMTCAYASAAVELRRARQLRGLPATAAAVDAGDLSLDHVDLLGRANQAHRAACFARDERVLVDQCRTLRFAQAARVVEYWCRRVDTQADRGDDVDLLADTHLHASVTLGGTVVVDGVLEPVGGAVFVDELNRLERELFLTDERDGIARTVACRRAAALVVMAQRSASLPDGSRPPRALFTVLVGDRAFTELCELANSTVIDPRQLQPWLTTADIETVLFDGPSTVISVSRRRSFTGALRRAVQVRDRHCQHPAGCDVPAVRCDVDHIVPHTRGGPTSQFNGRLECDVHNRNTDRHDHNALPFPARPVTRLDEIRARLRWQIQHDELQQGPAP